MGCKGVELDPEDQCGCETEAKGEHPKGNGARETLICFAHPQRRVLKRGMKVRKRLSRGVVRTSRRSMSFVRQKPCEPPALTPRPNPPMSRAGHNHYQCPNARRHFPCRY